MTPKHARKPKRPANAAGATVDPSEIERFSRLAESWWDPRGKFAILHKFNPTRLAFLRDRLCAHFARDPSAPKPLAGLRICDIGCGGGLLAEPLTRLGAAVTGIDAAGPAIKVAILHAEQSGLAIDYRTATVEDLAAAGERFDVVLNMEVVEHVVDPAAFIAASCGLVAPGGLTVVATLNRTPKSFVFGIVGAEYVLGWVPRGTHDWRKFVRPSELGAYLRQAGATLQEIAGVSYNPLRDRFTVGADTDINYMAVATL
ncbi:MAG: bifunctional 2-polyprenyl-6-hydroxyphenol methylase/3-demethylubiquinol 3-O-methyltransferase UbiG [Alphaproteobacteria bacterium]